MYKRFIELKLQEGSSVYCGSCRKQIRGPLYYKDTKNDCYSCGYCMGKVEAHRCVQCGYCCTQGVCTFGEWDATGEQCMYLTEDNECGIYEAIKDNPHGNTSPAFGAGCCSNLNDTRLRKLKELLNKEAQVNGRQ